MIHILLLIALGTLLGISLSRLYRRYGAWSALLALAALVLVLLVATGRAHWISIVVLAALALIRRLLMMSQLLALLPRAWRLRMGGSGGHAQFRTAVLMVTLDPLSGRMEGEVLSGSLAGRQLSELSASELRELLDYCRSADAQAALLLQNYIAYAHPDWAEADPSAHASGGTPPPRSTMSVEQARAVLGVEEGADSDAVLSAHRRMVQRLHPDRGGNAYLASLINQARDLLLEDRG